MTYVNSPRREPTRSHSWPPVPRLDYPSIHKGSQARSATLQPGDSSHAAFLDDLDNRPEYHFLAPINMYEYEDWTSDSDDDDSGDGEEIEWDAGITDFALFDSDRRRAQASNEPLPRKWTEMLENQTSALQRALDRRRANSLPSAEQHLLTIEDVPSLTPDNSPALLDDLDVESYHGQREARPSVPNYLTIHVSPPEDGDRGEETGDERYQPLFFSTSPKQPQSQARRRKERPGLRHSRTMSGQVHAWKRPGADMYTVGEEPDVESEEELCEITRIDSGYDVDARGRRRSWR